MAKKAAAGNAKIVKVKDMGKESPKETWWSNPKKAAKVGFEQELKEDMKEFKDDKEELAELKVRKAKFEELMGSFDEGLSGKLKAIEAEKKLEKLLPKCRDALEVVKRYRAKVKGVAGKIGNPQKTSMVLSGALDKIARSLETQIDILTDAL
jgi:hypothetical protein